MIKDFKIIKKCRICKETELISVLNLDSQPLANSLKKKQFETEKKFPLHVIICKNCKTSQLSCTINPQILFKKYIWVTGTSKSTLNYLEFFFHKSKKFLSKRSKRILEIASNDGSLLNIFKKNGHKILGVDPARNIVNLANQKNLDTVCGFFSYEFSKKNKKVKEFNPDLIIARNVLPHVENIHSVVKGISSLSDENTKVLIEFHYSKKIIDELQYDSIYHEHVFYFTIQTLSNIFKMYNLFTFDIFQSPISGGSLVLCFSKQIKQKSAKLKKFQKLENETKINLVNTWRKFGKLSYNHSKNFLSLISNFNHIKIVGFGASARSSTFLNFCDLNYLTIDSILDNNLLKQNKFTAGTNIKIINPKNFKFIKNHKYLFIILAWNFNDEIVKFLRNLKLKGFILSPFPKIKMIKL